MRARKSHGLETHEQDCGGHWWSAASGITVRAAVMVQSLTPGRKIMVERAMYWNSRGAGTDTIGVYSD